ncbi:MAG TPA: tRNA (adenosine(37)-N6)-threonylcarbamoyltransferase complex dimerization subunit type 1 TsaB [Acholeplasma sp.]|nr:tRNA (adenosine(37)-N6)-threonylcarbamoyltransferase complex dimerization subunit type 1 TsaB [Acholeplasma sp.]
MKTLIMDTATNFLIVGLIDNKKEAIVTRIGKNDNAAYLVNKIDEVLKNNNTTIDEIDEIIVGIGPGSYTGIRVSVVVAKTLAYSKGIKLKQISSIALLTSGYNFLVYGAIDARRNHYFAGKYLEGKEIVKDSYINKEVLEQLSNVIILNEETIKLNLNKISENARLVEDTFSLEPNYLRKTEAERNYDKINEKR